MTNILTTIAASKRREVKAAEALLGLDAIRELAQARRHRTVSMSRSILSTEGGVIAEFKRRSPSKGEIAPMADVSETVKSYQDNGAAACSILTDTPFFGGSIADITVARDTVSLPLLRKEFIVHPYQIYQAKAAGADAVLLIAALLSPSELAGMTDTAHSLGLEILLEIHSADEIYPESGMADMIGINNRDLRNFNTDIEASLRLIDKLPADAVRIAESGIHTSADMNALRNAGFNGFLVGEALMSTPLPGETLKRLIDGNL